LTERRKGVDTIVDEGDVVVRIEKAQVVLPFPTLNVAADNQAFVGGDDDFGQIPHGRTMMKFELLVSGTTHCNNHNVVFMVLLQPGGGVREGVVAVVELLFDDFIELVGGEAEQFAVVAMRIVAYLWLYESIIGVGELIDVETVGAVQGGFDVFEEATGVEDGTVEIEDEERLGHIN
jgi:hypothetical protein